MSVAGMTLSRRCGHPGHIADNESGGGGEGNGSGCGMRWTSGGST